MRIFLFALLLLSIGGEQAEAVDISTYASAGCAFPDANQFISYTATFGEDHDYASSISTISFTVYNPVGVSSVTVDNRTGLMWITNPQTDAGFNKPGPSTWLVAISSCEALSYAGYTDWRLPNVRELMSIVDFGAAGAPYINTAAFPGAASGAADLYWTSTSYPPNASTFASCVLLYYGHVDGDAKASSNYVRCVRGGP